MDGKEKIEPLKSLRLFSSIPEDQLATLAGFLTTERKADGETVFAEGTPGDSLYFVSSGHVRIAKRLQSSAGAQHKELAILAPGDCFGEMALLEPAPRSADAIASGETALLRLGREDLNRWLASHPALAMGFFAQLVQVLSGRLRRSSKEITLLYDLSQLLLEPLPTGKELLDKVMIRVVPYLEGAWVAGAYLYNEFNAEMDLVETEGDFAPVAARYAGAAGAQLNAWHDAQTYQVVFPGKKRVMGYILFHRAEALGGEEQNELARTLTTVGRLVAAALENLAYRTDEALRERLQMTRQRGGF